MNTYPRSDTHVIRRRHRHRTPRQTARRRVAVINVSTAHDLVHLAPADREILTLRYALEYDTNQIAELLEINPTAVHMRLSRARQRLAERLTAQGVQENHE